MTAAQLNKGNEIAKQLKAAVATLEDIGKFEASNVFIRLTSDGLNLDVELPDEVKVTIYNGIRKYYRDLTTKLTDDFQRL